MVSSLTLKILAGVCCLPLSVALLFALILKFGPANPLNLSQFHHFWVPSDLICEYVPPKTGKPPDGDGSGSRT
ncbi:MULTISPECIES: hypothetical protein [Planktothrix]|uniref:Uncharacterized protein n=1 Tax=Planktothrix tepida PCC 9214 TaxID=671072 RepID=A0A1J1LFV5_9CYAN|nr:MULTISPECIES: hypothetical protein [Planktothrix]CUR31054.1 exported hypothetical protein [Planktothrix tepida PCC 9214]